MRGNLAVVIAGFAIAAAYLFGRSGAAGGGPSPQPSVPAGAPAQPQPVQPPIYYPQGPAYPWSGSGGPYDYCSLYPDDPLCQPAPYSPGDIYAPGTAPINICGSVPGAPC